MYNQKRGEQVKNSGPSGNLGENALENLYGAVSPEIGVVVFGLCRFDRYGNQLVCQA